MNILFLVGIVLVLGSVGFAFGEIGSKRVTWAFLVNAIGMLLQSYYYYLVGDFGFFVACLLIGIFGFGIFAYSFSEMVRNKILNNIYKVSEKNETEDD